MGSLLVGDSKLILIAVADVAAAAATAGIHRLINFSVDVVFFFDFPNQFRNRIHG